MSYVVRIAFRSRTIFTPLAIMALAALAVAPDCRAQNPAPDQSQQQQQTPAQQPPAQPQQPPQPPQTAPAAGGPSGDLGPMAIPKKKESDEAPPPPAPAQPVFKNPPGAPNTRCRPVRGPFVGSVLLAIDIRPNGVHTSFIVEFRLLDCFNDI